VEDLARVRQWLEAGKQIGKSISFGEGEDAYWLSIGIQKWEGEYKLYYFKANEASMRDLEYYDAEGTVRVTHFEGLSGLVSALSPYKLCELAPLKGQKLFNPAFE
jgi:hypothetical protein